MLTVSQLHGFNALPSGGTAPAAAPNPDHAWRFYGLPASLDDAVGSAHFTGFGNWETASGINDQAVEMSAGSEYLARAGGIFGTSEYTLTGWFSASHSNANAADDISVLSVFRITNGTYYVEFRLDHESSPYQSWQPYFDHDGTVESGSLGRFPAIQNGWNFFAIRRDTSNNLKLFINSDSHEHTDPAVTDGAGLFINGFSTMQAVTGFPDDFLYIDELYHWDDELSDENIAWLYNGGAGRFVNGFGQF